MHWGKSNDSSQQAGFRICWGIVSLSHKPDKRPRARRRYAADRLRSGRKKRESAGEKATIPANRQNSGHAGKWLRGHTSWKNVNGCQPTNRFPDKLGKAPLSHKVGLYPRARRHLCRQPDAEQTEKRENRHRKVLALFLRRFSFYDARGNSPPVSSSNMRKNLLLPTQQSSHTGSREELPGVGFQGLRKPLRRSGAAEALHMPGFFRNHISPFSSAIFASLL